MPNTIETELLHAASSLIRYNMGSPKPDDQHKTTQQCPPAELGSPPPRPEPSNDAGIVPPIKSPLLEGIDHLDPETIDIFTLDAVAALKLLCRGTQLLVDMTGDVPPTPAARSPGPQPAVSTETPRKQSLHPHGFGSRSNEEHIDGVPFQRTPIGSPEAHMHEPIVHGASSQPAVIQYAALVRKFYSKRPPPISLEDYLTRMHKYCPMSTAVYLATSHYITHLAIREKICPVTPRNVHRLLLAGLRIAMKALEDLSWPHSRFAKVGGITETELGRLEIGFCFLMDFGLKVDARMLTEEAQHLIRCTNSSAIEDNQSLPSGFHLTLPQPRNAAQFVAESTNGNDDDATSPRSKAEKRKASSSLPMRPVHHVGQGIGIVGQS